MRIAVLVILGLLFTSPALGQSLCTEPVPPSCVEDPASYTDELSIRRCESDVADFDEKIAEFQSCMAQSVDAAEGLLEQVHARHACLADGKEECPLIDR